MRLTDAPEGLDDKAYKTRMIQILNAANEGKSPDGMVLNHISRYICRLSPSERTELENQFMRQLQRVCLFTDLSDATQAAALSALANRKVGEPDLLPFYVNAVCRKPSGTWRPNEVRLMQNRICPKTPPAVRVDVVSVIPGRVDVEPQYLVFLNGMERVEPTGRRDGDTAIMYIFDPARDIDTLVLQNKRGMRGMRIEGRLKSQVTCDVTVNHDELVAIIPLASSAAEGYDSAGCHRRQKRQCNGWSSFHTTSLIVIAVLLILLAAWLAMKK